MRVSADLLRGRWIQRKVSKINLGDYNQVIREPKKPARVPKRMLLIALWLTRGVLRNDYSRLRLGSNFSGPKIEVDVGEVSFCLRLSRYFGSFRALRDGLGS
jgi:hypothetical protein